MAAAAVQSCFDILPKCDYGALTVQQANGWAETETKIRLAAIAKAWMAARHFTKLDVHRSQLNNAFPSTVSIRVGEPLTVTASTNPPQHLPRESEGDDLSYQHNTDEVARQRPHDSIITSYVPCTPARRSPPAVGPPLAPEVDLQSQDGFKQTAKKKKGAAKGSAKNNWEDTEEKKDNADEQDGGGDKGGDGGDTGNAGNSNDRENGENGETGENGDGGDKNDDPPPEDEEWTQFAPVKTKKGKKGAKAEEIAAPTADKLDTFSEVKLDEVAPMLDLSVDTEAAKPKGGGLLGSWGASWATGATAKTTSKWDFGATTTNAPKGKSDNPWGSSKPEDDGAFHDALDGEAAKQEPVAQPVEDDFGFGSFGAGKKKKAKKGAVMVPEPVVELSTPAGDEADDSWNAWATPGKGKKGAAKKIEPTVELSHVVGVVGTEPQVEPTAEDFGWGFGTTKAKKGKKGKLVEEVPLAVPDLPTADDGWGVAFGSSKDKKKKEKVEDPVICKAGEFDWDSLEDGKKADGQLSASNDDWMNWDAKDKDPTTEAEVLKDDLGFDSAWGTTSKTEKTSKKGVSDHLLSTGPDCLSADAEMPKTNFWEETPSTKKLSKKEQKEADKLAEKARKLAESQAAEEKARIAAEEVEAQARVEAEEAAARATIEVESKPVKVVKLSKAEQKKADAAKKKAEREQAALKLKEDEDAKLEAENAKLAEESARIAEEESARLAEEESAKAEAAEIAAAAEKSKVEASKPTMRLSAREQKKADAAKKKAEKEEAALKIEEEEAAKLEANRLAAEEEDTIAEAEAEAEAARLVEEESAKIEADRLAAEETERLEAEIANTIEESTKAKASKPLAKLSAKEQKKADAARKKAEKEEASLRLKEEKEAKLEADRLAAEEKKTVAEAEAELEKARIAEEENAKIAADHLEAEDKERLETAAQPPKILTKKEQKAAEKLAAKLKIEEDERKAEEEETQRIAEGEAAAKEIEEQAVKDKENADAAAAKQIKKDFKSGKGKNSTSHVRVSDSMVDIPLVNARIVVEDRSEAFSFRGATKKSSKDTGASSLTPEEIANDDKGGMFPEGASEKDTETFKPASSIRTFMLTKKLVSSKIADRLKAFQGARVEDTSPQQPPSPSLPPPEVINLKPKEDKKKSQTQKEAAEEETSKEASADLPTRQSKVPGSFPEDDFIEIIDMGPARKSSKIKSGKGKRAAEENPVVVDPEPKAVEVVEPPDALPEPTRESKSSKKERPRVVRDGGSWGAWGAAPNKDEKKASRDRKREEPRTEKKPKDPDRRSRPKKTSDEQSTSDKADSRPPKSRGIASMFGPAPPLSRSKSMSEKRTGSAGKSHARRPSVALDESGLISPSPEEMDPPQMPSKAAKTLGVTPAKTKHKTARSRDLDNKDGADLADDTLKRKRKSRPIPVPPAVPMPPGLDDAPPRRRKTTRVSSAYGKSKHSGPDDDIVMVDSGGPSEVLGLNKIDSTAKKTGLSAMFGGLLGKSRPDNKRRSTAITDDEGGRGLRREDRKLRRSSKAPPETDGPDITMTGGADEEDQEIRKAARRARRAERDAAERAAEDTRLAKEDERKERRRKEQEIIKAEEREARKAARRKDKAQLESDRLAAEAKEAERAERRRARKEGNQADGEDVQNSRGPTRRESTMGVPADSDARRRRRVERRSTAPITSYFDARNSGKEKRRMSAFLPAEGFVYGGSKEKKPAGWPHSGTDSWVKDHSDAPPPPEDAPPLEGSADDGDPRQSSRKSRRTSRYNEEMTGDVQPERRRRRRSQPAKGSDSSEMRAPSASGGLFSRLKFFGN